MLNNNPGYKGVMAPSTLDVRYLNEDVPTGLVPMEEIGKLTGAPTPIITSLIDMAEGLTGNDYRRTGRCLANLGLENMSPEAILRHIRTGE